MRTAPAVLLAGSACIIAVPWFARNDTSNWTWGANLWGYLPAWYAWAAVVLGSAALAWGAVVAFVPQRTGRPPPDGVRRRGASITHFGRAGPASGSWWVLGVQLAACAVFFGLAWTARERIHFLGDTHLRLAAIGRVVDGASLGDVLRHGRAGPLDEALQIYGSGALARAFGWSAETGGQLMSCLVGLVYALACVRLSRLCFTTTRSRLVATAALLTAGYVQIFAGYAENYGLPVALLALWCGALLAERDLARPSLESPVLLALILLAHRDGVLIVPAHAWAWWRWRLAHVRAAGGRMLAGVGLVIAALVALVVAWLPQLREDIGVLLNPGPPDPRNIPLVSLRHLADIANALFLLGPAALVSMPWLPRVWAREWLPRPLLLAALPFGLIVLFVRSNFHGLGAVRDWDALAPAGFFMSLIAAVALGRLVERRRELVPLGSACVLAGALYTAAWIVINASPARALARAECITHATPHMPKAPHSLALDALGGIHFERGNYLAAARGRLEAADLFENARYVWAAGTSYWRASRPDSAQRLFLRAACNPDFRAGLIRDAGGVMGPPPDDPLLFAMWRAITVAESLDASRGALPPATPR